MVQQLNIEGDGQGDLAGHGGLNRAVMVYQLDSYRYWEHKLNRSDFSYGQFGENFTVDGLPDAEVCIGDCYRIGTALFKPGEKRYKKVLNEMIMDQILRRENLNAAYLAVKAAPGVDGMNITELKEQVRKHGVTLRRKLRAGEYQPAAVRAVEIPEANGGKRTLGIPTVLERGLQ